MIHIGRAFPLVSVALVAIAGCSETRQAQCNRLITVANQAVREVEVVVQANQMPNNEAFLKVADSAQKAKTEMQAVQLTDPQLVAFRDRYVSHYDKLGQSARTLVDAIQKQDFAIAKQAQESFQAVTREEPGLVSEINGYCNGTED